jgi:putative SOS response-associated peptidase YedK
MCYYNGQRVSHEEFIRLHSMSRATADFDFLDKDLSVGFTYNLNAVVVPVPGKQDFDIVQMEWGFIPIYARARQDVKNMRFGYKDAKGQYRPPITTLNAMGEELLKPGKIYRDAGLKRRCLVLSSGFFEWRHIYPINKKTGEPLKKSITYPYYIGVKDQPYFYMAGIWQPWADKETGEMVNTFAIVTTTANNLMEQVHNTKKRMPTILNDDLAYEWMFGDLSEERITELATTQFPTELMTACTIAKDFRESVEPTMAFEYEDLAALELSI